MGVKYLHAALLDHGHLSHILYFDSNDEIYFKIIANFIHQQSFDVVGISVFSRFFLKAAGLSAEIRKTCGPQLPIVWGGVHPTIDPEGCKSHCDYVCVGEAESSFPLFVDMINGEHLIGEVPGFTSNSLQGYTGCNTVIELDQCKFPEGFP